MNLKHIIASLFISCAVLSSCEVEEDEIFDQSSSLRADATAEAYNKILTSAQNGWAMEYYPGAYQAYGGYVVACKFNTDGTVAITADYATDAEGSYTATSLYQVTPDNGIKLTFDTYNEVFHFLSDPSNSGGAGLGDGYEGDFDFTIISCTPDKIILKGTKSGVKTEMYPLPANADEYLAQIDKLKTESFSRTYKTVLTISASQKATIKYSLSGQIISYQYAIETTAEDGSVEKSELIKGDIPFIYTSKGIKFYETVTIEGNDIREFVWDGEKFVDENGFIIEPSVTAVDIFLNGRWFLGYEASGIKTNENWGFVWEDYAIPIYEQEGEYLQYLYFGTRNGIFSFNMHSYSPAIGGAYVASAYLQAPYVYAVADNVIQMGLNQSDFGDQNAQYYREALSYFFYPFNGEFTIEFDDMNNPTMVTLTDNLYGDVYTLYASPIQWVLEN
ncbi:MAG: DUF4302 domain-containing protein [Bacteroidia bacterium]|nr:DUF4302 domain-containing protein [Bacteroidia bacterium]